MIFCAKVSTKLATKAPFIYALQSNNGPIVFLIKILAGDNAQGKNGFTGRMNLILNLKNLLAYKGPSITGKPFHFYDKAPGVVTGVKLDGYSLGTLYGKVRYPK